MKIFDQPQRVRTAGFTLVEIYIVSVIFLILVGAMVVTQFFAMRVYTLAATKLTATAGGRKAMNLIRNNIREAKLVDVGIYTNNATTFNSIGNGTNQIGNALLIFSTTNTTTCSIFYIDLPSSNLLSATLTGGSYNAGGTIYTATTIANLATNVPFITNFYIFDAEDYLGNILKTNSNNRIIGMTLQFSQWEYPIAGVGNGAMYDYYQLHTKATRRAID